MKRRGIINRRSLLAAPAILLLPRKEVLAAKHGGIAWPGLPSNPVGYTAAPGYPGTFPTGGSATTLSALATSFGGTIPSGTPGSPITYAFYDFNPSNYPSNSISGNGLYGGGALHDVIFLGCRFQSSEVNSNSTNVDIYTSGSYNIKLSYCSIVPTISGNIWFGSQQLVNGPPHPGWPSGGALTGVTGGSVGEPTYEIPWVNGTTFGLQISSNSGAGIIVDHCDIWGCGDFIQIPSPSTLPVTITNNWLHDCRNPNPVGWDSTVNYPPTVSWVFFGTSGIYQATSAPGNMNQSPTLNASNSFWTLFSNHGGDHQDGVGYMTGAPPTPSNILIQGNTIAAIANTNAIAFQHNSPITAYSNIAVVGNYLSGFNQLVDMGSNQAGNNNLTFTDNILSTVMAIKGYPVYLNFGAQFTRSTNLWRRNRMLIPPEDTWSARTLGRSFIPSNSGMFMRPDQSLSATDWDL